MINPIPKTKFPISIIYIIILKYIFVFKPIFLQKNNLDYRRFLEKI